MKRILLFTLISSVLSFASGAEAQITNPFLWELSKGGKTITLFGSLHVGKTDFYPLPAQVLSRFDASKVLAVESDVTRPEAQAACDRLGATDEPLTKILPTDDYNAMMNYVRASGVNAKLLEKRKLWMVNLVLVAVELSQLGVDFSRGLDVAMLTEARTQKKKVVEIEGGEKQCASLAGATNAESIAGLNRFISTVRENKMEVRLNEMLNAYRAGDGASILKTITEEYGTTLEGQRSKKRFLDDRHPAMAEVIDAYFAKPDSHFVVVGVGHLLGDNNLLEALEKRGVKAKRL